MNESILRRIDDLANELKSLQPIKPEFLKILDKKFRLEFSYNSNHIEGNTLTYNETELLLLFDDTKGNHTFREYQEMKAHDVAYKLICDYAKDNERPLNETFIKELNKVILVQPFWKDATTLDGQKTRRPIKVGEYKEYPNSVRLQNGEIFEYASPSETPALMNELIQWYKSELDKKEIHSLVLASLFHYKFVCIHPFDDGNGRISRLLMNYILLKNDYPPVIIKSANKKDYLSALHSADTGDIDTFHNYIAQQLIWSLEISIKAAKGESISEPDDLDKEIAILKREAEQIQTSKIEKVKTPDTINEVIENDIYNIVIAIQEKISKFKDFYKGYSEHYHIQLVGEQRNYNNHESFFNNINSYIQNIVLGNISFDLGYFIKSPDEAKKDGLMIIFTFDQLTYRINIEQVLREKKYSQRFTKQEINEIVELIGENRIKKVKQFIDELNNN